MTNFLIFVKIRKNDFLRKPILIMNLSFEEVKILLFLRNEFSKIFEDFFGVTKITEITHIYDQEKN